MDLSNYKGFLDLFEKWNRSINLSAASSRAEISAHVEDSLHVVPHLRGLANVLDVGSGGGFPVVIAAIALPEVQFVSLEPVHKKQAFLKTAARELGLANLEARAERISRFAVSSSTETDLSGGSDQLPDRPSLTSACGG